MDTATSAEIIQSWSVFYATMAAVSATLAGLLFFSLTLNIEPLLREEQRGLLLMAYHTLATFLIIVLYSMCFLMPGLSVRWVALLLMLGSVSMLALSARLQVRRLDPNKHRYALQRLQLVIIPTWLNFLLPLAMVIWEEARLFYLFAFVLLIQLLTAGYNAWWLLIRARGYTDPQGR